MHRWSTTKLQCPFLGHLSTFLTPIASLYKTWCLKTKVATTWLQVARSQWISPLSKSRTSTQPLGTHFSRCKECSTPQQITRDLLQTSHWSTVANSRHTKLQHQLRSRSKSVSWESSQSYLKWFLHWVAVQWHIHFKSSILSSHLTTQLETWLSSARTWLKLVCIRSRLSQGLRPTWT
jgi:hypothetical protein